MYKDKVKGIVSENDYIELVTDFTKERENYLKEKQDLERKISEDKVKQDDTDKLEKLVNEFLKLDKPTKALLNELIEKITISENHEITIYYKFSPLNKLS